MARDAETSEPRKPIKSFLKVQEDKPDSRKPSKTDWGDSQLTKMDRLSEIDEAAKSHQ